MLKIKTTAIDKVFSLFIRARAGGRCEYCGKSGGKIDCSHFIGRRQRATRWDPDNACAACFSCHQYLDEHPYQHSEFFLKRLGSERFEELNIRSEGRPPKPKETAELMQRLKGQLAQLVKDQEVTP